MSVPFASVGGLASGLDTADIIQQLMQLERQPMRVLQNRVSGYQQTDQAWSQVLSKLSGLRSSLDGFNDPAGMVHARSATSSDEQVATASVSGQPAAGSLSLDVDTLASAHRVALGGSFSSPDVEVGEGTLSLERGGLPWHEVELGEGASLRDAAAALNDVDGLSASIVKVDENAYRLLVTGTETGAANQFTIDTDIDDFDTVDVLEEGQDAVMHLGTMEIKRDSNTVTDLIEGVELQLTGTGSVTIDVEHDVDAVVDEVDGLVTQLNDVFNHLAQASRASQDADQRGPLAGNSLVRSIVSDLRTSLSSVTGDGEHQTLSQIGISLTRDGTVEFDETLLRGALAEDADGVAELLGRMASTTEDGVEVTRLGQAEAGEFELTVTKAAEVAAVTGASYEPPAGASEDFTISVAGQTVSVTVPEGATIDQAVDAISDALAAEGVSRLAASHDGDALMLEATRAGSSSTFTVADSGALGLDGTHEGEDAEGTIATSDGSWSLSGNGAALTVDDGPAQGMVVRVPTDTDGPMGNIVISDGLGGTLDRVLGRLEGSDGAVARARSSLESRISATETSIEAFERRLETRERSIRAQFAALESAMSRMNTQSAWLSSQLGQMQA